MKHNITITIDGGGVAQCPNLAIEVMNRLVSLAELHSMGDNESARHAEITIGDVHGTLDVAEAS